MWAINVTSSWRPGLALRGVRASVETEAVCTSNSTFLYMYNSLDQSPCLVAAYLLSACTDGNWDLPALSSNNTGYQASTGNGTYVPCICTTVMYSLVSGCSICQFGLSVFSTWPAYSTECTTLYDRRLPMGIPTGTAVPSWAYQDVITKGSFDITVVNGTTAPDSTVAVNGPTSSNSLTSTSTSIYFYPSSKLSFFPTASGTPTATSSSSKSNNAGAIVGGVVGGVIGLVGTGLLIFLILRHKKKKRSGYGSGAREATGEVGGQHTPRLSGYYAGGNPPMTQTDTPVSAGYGSSSTPNSGASLLGGQKIYNPDDPSTYPAPVNSPYVMQASENRAYRGFPEV